jgi:hypothetical protein
MVLSVSVQEPAVLFDRVLLLFFVLSVPLCDSDPLSEYPKKLTRINVRRIRYTKTIKPLISMESWIPAWYLQ